MEDKIFSRDIYARILSFSRPYARYFIGAIIISLAVVALELSVPVITRYLVDNHITARYHVITDAGDLSVTDTHPDLFLRLSGSVQAIRHDKIEYLPSGTFERLKDEGVTSDTLYYVTELPDGIDPAAYVGLQRHGRFGIMPVKMLDSLPHHMLVKLRRDDLRAVAVLGSVIILCIVLSFGLTYAGVILVTSGGQNVIHDMRMALYSHVSMLPMRYFDTHKSGKIVTRLTNDINNIEEFFTAVFINIFKDIFILTGIISVLIVLNPRLGGVTLLLMPVIIAVSLGFRVRMRRAFRRVREALASVNARLSETITGATVIQQFNRQDRYNEKFVSDNNAYFKASENQVFVNSLFNPIISFIRFAGLGIIVYIGSRFVIGGALSLGTLIVFISYLEKFFQPIQDIAEKINIMQSAMASSERIFDLLDEPEEPDADPALTFEKLMSRESEYLIEFDNVTFAYNDDEPVLKNFTLKICHGESVALVGHTGCGKTTVISLLSRLYPVENGTIRIQGVDIRTVPLAVLRRAIGVVQQDVTLFSDTVRRNILLGRSESSAELDTVCEYTNCSGFIEKLPDGFDTVLSEEGMSLSFGERQLISFARVISYDPDIFVLDEATSNIDTETEILIQDTLNRILENKTSIVIAHRLSTIKHCDRIVVMHHGEIIEQGTHTELLNRRETYYRLYLLQYRTQTGSGIKGFTK